MPLRMVSRRMLRSLPRLAALFLFCGAAAATQQTPDCLDPAHVRGWSLLPGDQVLVDAGKRRFVIELVAACPGLEHNPFLGFVSQRTGSRVCGVRGDQLVPHGSAAGGRPPCPIGRLRVVDDAEYADGLERRVQADGIGS